MTDLTECFNLDVQEGRVLLDGGRLKKHHKEKCRGTESSESERRGRDDSI